jgi:hypothetical protein
LHRKKYPSSHSYSKGKFLYEILSVHWIASGLPIARSIGPANYSSDAIIYRICNKSIFVISDIDNALNSGSDTEYDTDKMDEN